VSEIRYVILAENVLDDEFHGKTTRGVLRYSHDEIVAVVDSTYAGKNVSDVMPGVGRSIPIVTSVRDALAFRPTSLLIGAATVGGKLPKEFRSEVLTAIDAGMDVVNGLHELLRDDAEIVARAKRSGSRLRDVRDPEEPGRVFTGAAYDVPQFVVLAVGSDCAVGKMTVMCELDRAASGGPLRSEFVATGQTGIMIAGKGIAVDRVISDYICGAGEQLVLGVDPATRVTLVEGQGSILHPAYAPVTFGLVFGTAPDALILCHRAGQAEITEFGTPIPSLRALITLHEQILGYVKPARCIAIALNTSHLSEQEARREIEAVANQTGLPTDDVVRFGGGNLWKVIASAAERGKTPKRTHVPVPAR